MPSNDPSANGARRDRILQAIRAKSLPFRSPDRTWGGKGSGAPCSLCGQSVRADEIEWELEFSRGVAAVEADIYKVHPACLDEWDAARRELQRVERDLPGEDCNIRLPAGEREAALDGE